MGRPGFTLVEIVIALALVVALAAIAMPSIGGRLGSARSDALARDLCSAVAQIRGDAVRDAESYRIVLAPQAASPTSSAVRWRLEARAFRPGRSGAAVIPDRFVGPIFDEPSPADPAAFDEIPSRVLLVLPHGVSVSREPPAPLEAVDGLGDVASADPLAPGFSEFARGDSPGLTLGVLLATGAAVAGAPIYLTLPSGGVLELRLDPWTGVLSAKPWQPPEVLDPWDVGASPESGTEGLPSGMGGRP